GPPAAATPIETVRVVVPPPPGPARGNRRGGPVTRPPAPPPAPAEQWGYITIDATPVAGTVYVDGVEAGFTPLAGYRVRPGTRTIRIQSVGYRTVTERVLVEAGNTVRKRYSLIPEG
ncbi:MAG: PEGA domain-containing protein, partial [Gemmatimonadales bacterium]